MVSESIKFIFFKTAIFSELINEAIEKSVANVFFNSFKINDILKWILLILLLLLLSSSLLSSSSLFFKKIFNSDFYFSFNFSDNQRNFNDLKNFKNNFPILKKIMRFFVFFQRISKFELLTIINKNGANPFHSFSQNSKNETTNSIMFFISNQLFDFSY